MQVASVPAVPQWAFRYEGVTYRTDASGKATLPALGRPDLKDRLEPAQKEVELGPDARARFVKWHAGPDPCILAAIFEVSYPVDWIFKDTQGRIVPPETLGKVTVRSSLGVLTQFDPEDTTWLKGSGVVAIIDGQPVPVDTYIHYSVEQVEVRGQNVVNRSQHRIFPYKTRVAEVRTVFFQARVGVRDGLFGFPLGRAIDIRYPDGSVSRHRLDSRAQVTVEYLPPGAYDVTVEGPALPIDRQMTISKNQGVDLRVVSYLDLGVLALIALAGLVALTWRCRRRKLAKTVRVRALLPPPPPPAPKEPLLLPAGRG